MSLLYVSLFRLELVKESHCLILNKNWSNAMVEHENFIKIAYYLAIIDKDLDILGHIRMT